MLGIAHTSARAGVNMPTWATGFLETHTHKKIELRLHLKSYSVVFMGKSRLCHSGLKDYPC